MNLLIDKCPEAIEIAGKVYPINSDHRTSILFELAVRDHDLTDEQKVQAALDLYYDTIPEDIDQALRGILWFHSSGKSEETKETEEGENYESEDNNAPKKEIYSLDHDSEYIFSSFLLAYNIDLTEETLHWWKFMALFNTLPEDTIIKQIIKIRTTEVTPNMSKEEKKRTRELKKIYALPDTMRIQDEAGEAFGNALGELF